MKIVIVTLIAIAIAVYTVCFLIFVEMPSNYRLAITISEYFLCIGISILVFHKGN